jgi:hypothetical protein
MLSIIAGHWPKGVSQKTGTASAVIAAEARALGEAAHAMHEGRRVITIKRLEIRPKRRRSRRSE